MNHKELMDWLKEKLKIDDIDLDKSSIDTPQLHGEIMNLYSSYSLQLKSDLAVYKKLKLERWKYYTGKQTDQYYKKYGNLKEIVLKTDLPMYLEADDILQKAEKIIDERKMCVEVLENALKQIQQRPFIIKDVISWRKFVSGIG